MALSEFEIKRVEKLVGAFIEKRRPPPPVRKDFDLGFRLRGQSVEIFEVRPMWTNPDEAVIEEVAKATYIKSRRCWRVYWQRSDLKWHRYTPLPEVDYIEDFIAELERDEFGCFFG